MTYTSYSQEKTVTADTFSYAVPFSFRSIVLRSDSTFYEKRRSCTFRNHSIGTWESKCDVYKLTFHSYPAIKVSSETYCLDDTDSLVTFTVKDWNGNPIKDYAIEFDDNILEDTTILTDKNGSATIKRNLYSGYYTQTDDNNQDYSLNSVDLIRFLSKYSNSISIILSIPIYSINSEQIHGAPFIRTFFLRSN